MLYSQFEDRAFFLKLNFIKMRINKEHITVKNLMINNFKTNEMKIINNNMSIKNFKAWSGALDTQETIIYHNKCDEFDFLIEELFYEGLTETQLNDFLWFEEDWIYEMLNIRID